MIATSADGRRFELRENGTWTLLPSESESQRFAGFRKAAWGSSRAVVRSSESAETTAVLDSALIYSLRLAELAVDAVYIFVDDTLTRAKYVVTESYSNDYNFVVAFESLRELLVKKYGHPLSDDEYWSNDLWKDEPYKLGMAAITGDYSRYVKWSAGGTGVLLYFSGENYKADLGVEYRSLELESMEQARRESDTMSDL